MRTAEFKRKTRETDVSVFINLDGTGISEIETGIGFFDHMLTSFATHGGFDLKLNVKGDLEVDCHHTAEDAGIALGKAIGAALGDKKGIARFADVFIPMDEALAFAALDISGRSFIDFHGRFSGPLCGDYETSATEEFFRALAINAEITLHLRTMYGNNDHHMTEALFKACARAFSAAVKITGSAVPSAKGSL
jgi:Imidazoleglycerol-phosphate dehydratase